MLLAALAAAGWAAYIVLTQQVGDRFEGLSGLAMTVPIAAAVDAAIVGIPEASGHLTLGVVLAGAGLALLLQVQQQLDAEVAPGMRMQPWRRRRDAGYLRSRSTTPTSVPALSTTIRPGFPPAGWSTSMLSQLNSFAPRFARF